MAFYLKDRVFNSHHDFTHEIQQQLAGVTLPPGTQPGQHQLIVLQGDAARQGQALYILSGNSPTRVTDNTIVNNVCRLYRACYGESHLPPLIPYLHSSPSSAPLTAPSSPPSSIPSTPSISPPSSITRLDPAPSLDLIKTLQDHISTLTDEVRTLKNEMHATLSEETVRTREMLALDQRDFFHHLNNLQNHLINEIASSTTQYQQDIIAFKTQIDTLKSTLDELRPKIDKTDKRMTQLRSLLNRKLKTLHDALETKINATSNSLRQELITLSTGLDTHRNQQNSLREEITALKNTSERILQQQSDLTNEITRKVNLIQTSFGTLKDDLLNTSKAQQKSLHEAITNLQATTASSIEKTNESVTELHSLLNRLHGELETKIEAISTPLRQELNTVSTGLNTHRDQQNSLREEITALTGQLKGLLTTSQEQQKSLHEAITNLQATIASSTEKNRIILNQNLKEISDNNNKELIDQNTHHIRDQIQELTTSLLAQSSSQLSSFQSQISALEQHLENLSQIHEGGFNETHQRLSLFCNEVNGLTNSINELIKSLDAEPLTEEKLQNIQSALDLIQRSLDLNQYASKPAPISYVPNEAVALLREKMFSLEKQFLATLKTIEEKLPSTQIHAESINQIVSGIQSPLLAKINQLETAISSLKEEFTQLQTSQRTLDHRDLPLSPNDDISFDIDSDDEETSSTSHYTTLSNQMSKHQHKTVIYETLEKTLNNPSWLKKPDSTQKEHRWIQSITNEYMTLRDYASPNSSYLLNHHLSRLSNLQTTTLTNTNDFIKKPSKLVDIIKTTLQFRICLIKKLPYQKEGNTNENIEKAINALPDNSNKTNLLLYNKNRLGLERFLINLYNATKEENHPILTEFPPISLWQLPELPQTNASKKPPASHQTNAPITIPPLNLRQLPTYNSLDSSRNSDRSPYNNMTRPSPSNRSIHIISDPVTRGAKPS